jgi:asparagine synthase (glutamine-hydrolysing)
MRIGGGRIPEAGTPSMGYSTYYHSNNMYCSHPEGITDTVVCDADLHEIDNPPSYFQDILTPCVTHSDLIEAMKTIYSTVRGGYAVAFTHGDSNFLFRDPVGIKTLFYAQSAFASERRGLSAPSHPVYPGEVVQLPHRVLFRHAFTATPSYDPESLYDSLEKSISASLEGNAAVLFSGGIDSALLAALSDVPVITCGIEGSPDIEFSQEAAKLLQKDHIQVYVRPREIEKALPEVMNILEQKTLMHIEIGLLIYFVCRTWQGNILISGQGADELFGGYYKHEKAYREGRSVRTLMNSDFQALPYGLERDGYIAERFQKKIRYPYLDHSVIEQALGIPTNLLFEPQRKAFLRRVADLLSLPPEIVQKPKKAMQYGSGFHKVMKKMNLNV